MNESNHTDASLTDELQDRLVDRALHETLGRETPPELSARILAVDVKSSTSGSRPRSRRSLAAMLAVAASLVIAIPVVLTRHVGLGESEYRGSVAAVRSKRQTVSRPESDESSIRSRGMTIDAGGPWESSVGRSAERGEGVSSTAVDTFVDAEVQYSPADASSLNSDQYTPPAAPLSVAQQPNETTISLGHQWQDSSISGEVAVDRLASSSDASEPTLPELKDGESSDEHFLRAYQLQAQQGIMKRGRSRFALRDQSAVDLETVDPTHTRGWQRSAGLGTGPGSSGDEYMRIYENPFVKAVGGDAVSTFSIDVDTASYANVRQFLVDMRQLPPPDAVRIEELVNYFDYDYAGPQADDEAPFAAHIEVAGCPWSPEHRLVRIGVKGREIANDKRPPSNLVFLVDVSGSMDEPNKLPLVVDGLRQLTRELGENDRVAIVVYASSEGLALPSTRGDQQQTILDTLGRLRAGGSTAGGAGIQLAYQIAEDHFIPGGTNRVVLCTDGDFNVGMTSTAELERLVAQKAKDTKVFLSVLGFGRGNLNDAMMQTIADRGNGNHHYVDNLREARKVLVEEITGTLVTIAKDVKLQVEFNPAQVAAYRLIGYENRLLRTEDFNDDTKDAGEIGAGHTVTALYEVIPAGQQVEAPAVDELKYQPAAAPPRSEAARTETSSNELLTLKMRYKQPEGDTSRKLEWSIADARESFQDASTDFQFAAAVVEFGLLLRGSEFRGTANLDTVAEIALGHLGADQHGYRAEFVELVRRAKELTPND